MSGILILFLFLGLILYLLGYLFFRSLLWVFEPLIKYFSEKEISNSFTERNDTKISEDLNEEESEDV